MAGLSDLANRDYVERVNRAIDHVMRHLDQRLQLDDVAKVACFSPFHFHRIFRAIVGETLQEFVKRVRLERAVYLMSHRDGSSLTDIALAVGFASSSDFSRSFRAHFGVPPSLFDVETYRRAGRTRILESLEPDARHRVQQLPPGENPDGFVVRIRKLPPRRVAYLRVLEPYQMERVHAATMRLLDWARKRGLAGGQWLGYQWDDPEIVALEDCRYDIGLEVPDDATIDDGISVTTFPPMTIAEVDIVGTVDLELRALHWIYRTWLPTSGYVPDHQPMFEAFDGEPFAHGTEHFELRAQLAVVEASAPI